MNDQIDALYAAIGQRIRTAREARGLNQTALGATIGLGRSSVSNVEAGRQHLAVHQLVAAITSLDTVSRTASDPVARAIAGHLHTRITDTVEEVITRLHRGDGAEPVVIVIDDRAASSGDEQPPSD